MTAPEGWAVPAGWTPRDVARCRSCNAEVLWCVTPHARLAPVDRDGVSHFATCPQASTWRKPR